MFGYVGEGGTVRAVNLTEVEISGSVIAENTVASVGGVVGNNYSENTNVGTVKGCTFNGTVTAKDPYSTVGGVVGLNDNKVSDNTNVGTVKGTGDGVAVGGVVGTNSGTVTNNGYYKSDTATYKGVGGATSDTAGQTAQLYKLTLPEGATAVQVDSKEPPYTETDKDGKVTAVYAPAGKDVTFTYNGSNLTDDDGDETNNPTSTGNSHTYKMGSQDTTITDSSFLGQLDFDDTDGSYLIKDAQQLKALADYVNGTNGSAHTCAGLKFKVAGNITLSGDWTPIGTDKDHAFKGTFDGGSENNFTIDGLKITSNATYAGLFGYVGSYGDTVGTIQNVSLTNVNISGKDYVGGVVGENSDTVQDNINVDSVSGVVGYNNGGTVQDNYHYNGNDDKFKLYKLTLPKDATEVNVTVTDSSKYYTETDAKTKAVYVYATSGAKVTFTYGDGTGVLKDDDGDDTNNITSDGTGHTYTMLSQDTTIKDSNASSGGGGSSSGGGGSSNGSSSESEPVTPSVPNVNLNGKSPEEATSASLDSDFSGTFDATDYPNVGVIKVDENCQNDLEIIGNDNGNRIMSGAGNDELSGGAGNDKLNGGAGNDKLDGGEGNDELSGGEGDDVLTGGTGDDELNGGEGDDELSGGEGNDDLYGGTGNDKLHGDEGDDVINGDAGNDKLFGGIGDDELNGGEGIDELFGGDGSDILNGGEGEDKLFGEAGDDKLYGDAGNDILKGDIGNDELFGGDGIDTLYGGEGEDKLFGEAGDDKLYGDAGNDILKGDDGNDELFGGEGSDALYGGADNDKLYGGDGSDILKGDDGNDVLSGGAGDDLLWGDAGADTFIYDSGDGNDIIYGFGNDDTLLANGFAESDILPVYDASKKSVTVKLGEGSVTFKNFTATEFHIGESTWQLSGSTFTKK